MSIRNKRIACVAVAIVACALVGCASSKVTKSRSYAANESLPRPNRIVVHDFAATANDAAANANTRGHYAQGTTPQTAQQIELGRKLGDRVAQQLVAEILALGMPVECAGSGPPPGQGDVLIQGEFVSLDPGSRTQRMIVGFGAGTGRLQAHFAGYQMTPAGLRRLGDAAVKTSGGKMPGMLVPIGVGAAAGNPAQSTAVSGGLNVAQEAGPEGLNTAAKNTAKEIAKRLSQEFMQLGWIAPSKAR